MPCMSEYRPPDEAEIELAKVITLINEVENGVKPDSSYGKETSSTTYSEKVLHKYTAKLCSLLKQAEVSKYSLELQLWWRDHQAADKRREEQDAESKLTEQQKKVALAKLTPHERKLLGLG